MHSTCLPARRCAYAPPLCGVAAQLLRAGVAAAMKAAAGKLADRDDLDFACETMCGPAF